MSAVEVVAAAFSAQGINPPHAHAMVALSALKAAGYAVVELPEGELDDDGQLWFADYDIRVDRTGASADHGDIITDFGRRQGVQHQISVAAARNWGLALLAAANAAEVTE